MNRSPAVSEPMHPESTTDREAPPPRGRLAGLLFLVLLTGCSRPAPAPDDYFPLQPGLTWHYRVTTEVGGKRRESAFSERNAAPQPLKGVARPVRVTSDGTRYYFHSGPKGVYRVAKRTVVELRPRLDPQPRWVLKRPFVQGTTWSSSTHPYVLRRTEPYEQGMSHGTDLKMTYQITASDASVEVPAGRFEHCLEVQGEVQLSVYADGRKGYRNIDINTTEWYAPGIGLVKLVREEPLNEGVFAGGRATYELVAFTR